MILKVVTLACIVASVVAQEHHGHAVSEQEVIIHLPEHRGHHGELGHIGHKPEHHEAYADAYPSYEFSYTVNDPHTHDQKGQKESRHGDEVKGEYWLQQPDGRKRIVKYHANKHTGFKAEVNYEGIAHHPNEVHHKEQHNIPHVPHIVHVVENIEKHIPNVEIEEIKKVEEINEKIEEAKEEKRIENNHEEKVVEHHQKVEHEEPIHHLILETKPILQDLGPELHLHRPRHWPAPNKRDRHEEKIVEHHQTVEHKEPNHHPVHEHKSILKELEPELHHHRPRHWSVPNRERHEENVVEHHQKVEHKEPIHHPVHEHQNEHHLHRPRHWPVPIWEQREEEIKEHHRRREHDNESHRRREHHRNRHHFEPHHPIRNEEHENHHIPRVDLFKPYEHEPLRRYARDHSKYIRA